MEIVKYIFNKFIALVDAKLRVVDFFSLWLAIVGSSTECDLNLIWLRKNAISLNRFSHRK